MLLFLVSLAIFGCSEVDSRLDKRQTSSSCPVYSFQCNSGQCIKDTSVCDGAVDCKDGSDETLATCSKLNVECPAYAFRCAYGACVDKKVTCNDIQDCADNSDELLPECGNSPSPISNSVCKKNEFTCNSGQCVKEVSLCDGTADCYDGSDETITQCINVKCPGYSFQCAYGACIDKAKKCNNYEDCKDGSDEDPEICFSGVSKPSQRPVLPSHNRDNRTRGCILPEKPRGGEYEVVSCADRINNCQVPGSVVPGLPFATAIRFSCNDGFVLPGPSRTSFCDEKGEWEPPLPKCEKLCPPLKSTSVDVSCYYLGEPVNCTKPNKPGTTATVRCKPSYLPKHSEVSSTFSETECLSDGTWAYPLFNCAPECGIKNYASRPLLSYSPTARESEYPWHAGLYREYGNLYICGGSIISEKAILTAAHCVYNETLKRTIRLADFMVAVGKFHRSWDIKDANEQRFSVSEIVIRDTYLGKNNRYEHDIAVISISGIISVNPSVMPVCIDRHNAYQLQTTESLTVVGWGRTETSRTSDELRVAHLPYFGFHKCRDEKVSLQFATFITYDKFCAGLTNGTHLGNGDSGGGLTYRTKSENNKEMHYLFGIVSVTDPNNQDITAFTNVTIHIPWFDKVLLAIKKSRSP